MIEDLDKYQEEKKELDKQLTNSREDINQFTNRLETLQDDLTFEDKESAEKKLKEMQEVKREYDENIKEAEILLQNCKEKYQDLRSKEKNLRANLADKQNSVQKTKAEFFGKLEQYNFDNEEDFSSVLKDEEKIKKWEQDIETYKNQLLITQENQDRLEEITSNKVWQDIDFLQKQKELSTEKCKRAREQGEQYLKLISRNESIFENIQEQLPKYHHYEERFNTLYKLYRTITGQLKGRPKLAFESYILAVYFRDILQKGNRRLAVMTNRQYKFVLREEEQNNQKASGLLIDIIDKHTGRRRGVETLSGGESFMAALSLALGLSDAVQDLVGGIQISTLFVDEGFGGLDTDNSLKQALNSLIMLADNNRLVGIISHVKELKNYIDNRIDVDKFERGSKVKLVY